MRLRLSFALGFFGLLVATLVGYYYVHKPLTVEAAMVVAQTLGTVVVVAWFTALGGGLGLGLLRLRTHTPTPTTIEEVVLAVALGWGAVALLFWALGLVGGYWPLVAWGLLLGGTALLHRSLWAWARGLAQNFGALWEAPDGLNQLALGLLGLTLSLSLGTALAPPLRWDSLVYHLTLPERYIAAHGLHIPAQQMSLFTGMPQLGEMLYVAVWLLRGATAEGAIAAQLVGWVASLLMLTGTAAYGRRLGLPGPLAPALLVTAYSIVNLFPTAYVEPLMMLFGVALLLALHQWQTTRPLRWLVVAALLAGLGWGGKYTGVILPLGGGVVVLWATWQQRAGWGTVLRDGAVFGAVALAAFAPWLLKNAFFFGSPVYPLLFPAGDMDALRQWFYTRPDLRDHPLWQLLLFWRAAFLGVHGGNEYDVTLGPTLVVAPLMLVFGWRWLNGALKSALMPLVVFLGAAYAGWVLLSVQSPLAHQMRLFYPAFPALALLGATGLQHLPTLDTPQLRLTRVIYPVLALLWGLGAFELSAQWVAQNPLPYLFGRQTGFDYRQAHLGPYATAMRTVNQLPDDQRVKFLWEARALGCAPAERCDPDVVIDRWWHLRRTLETPEAILAQWQAEGFTHVLIYDQGVAFVQQDPTTVLTAADWAALEDLRAHLTLVETFNDVYRLYAINSNLP